MLSKASYSGAYNGRMMLRLALFSLIAMTSFAQPPDWDEPFTPHRIADNLYYVGSRGLASYLVTTPEGHILINSSFDRTLPIIRDGVEKLGFKFTDIKILLASHAHNDHVAGHAQIQKLTGAKVFVMEGDDTVTASGGVGTYLYKSRWTPTKVDRVLKDGDLVKLAGITLKAVHTPGHTRGCTTWTMKVADKGKTYDVVIVGSPNVNEGFQLVGNKDYPGIASDFAKSFQVFKALHCDIFLGAHGSYYGMEEKVAKLGGAMENPFVDPDGYRKYIADRERHYLKVLAEQKRK